ncbi:hypothetical protein C0989_003979 [Termitomyces sp. Mn162]|nr:hypothetical protein C0989_003979 [Termitomyces sp. Mn162]
MIRGELRRGNVAIQRSDGTVMGRLNPMIGHAFVSGQPEQRAGEFARAVSHTSHRLNKIIDDDPEIPLICPWTLRANIDEHLTQHLKELEIPTLHGMPSLLLHRLGKQMSYDIEDDQQRMKRINKIFAPQMLGTDFARHTSVLLIIKESIIHLKTVNRVLLNTPGAGKTRLVLEGLLAKWGFYFRCRTQVGDIGSADIEHVIEFPYGHLNAFGLEEIVISKEELEVNQACAARCFQAVLAARLLVFLLYLRAIVGHSEMTTEEAKKKWLFAQIDARILATDQQNDFFLYLATLLCYVNTQVLVSHIRTCLVTCKTALGILNPCDTQIHFVIDEAQVAAETYHEAFRDGSGKNKRPVLRALLFHWATFKIQTIITGTSLEHKLITDAISSSVGKTANMNDGLTSTGSWMSDKNKIEAYLKSYFPATYLETPSGKELQTRAITRYFIPRDGEWWEGMEAELSDSQDLYAPHSFDFERAEHPGVKTPLLLAMQKLCYHRLTTGDLNHAASTRIVNRNIVECGFARYGSDTKSGIIFDEPLAYIAAEAWISRQESTWEQKQSFFLKSLELYNKNNELENYTMLCLAHAFMQPTKLSSVFEFADIGSQRHLAERKARLVSCWVDSSGVVRSAPVIFPIQCTGNEGLESPSHILCKKSSRSNAEDDLDWLRCDIKTPFFVPLTHFGPDIFFRLRLEDGTNELVTVAVQVKSRATKLDVKKSLIQKAIRTVSPDTFWTNDTCEKVLKNANAEKDQVDSRHELAILPSQYVKNLTEQFEPPNALGEYETGVKQRNAEVEFQQNVIRFENRKPYEIFDKFTRRDQIERYMILDHVVLDAATDRALGGQLDLHRRMEWAFNQATRRVPPSQFRYVTPTRHNEAMSTRTAKLEAVREAIVRWTVMEAVWNSMTSSS